MNVAPLMEARGAGTSQAARLKWPRRPTLSHALIALAVILAFVFNFLALQDRGETELVAIAGKAIPAGSTVGPSDIELIPISSSFGAIDSLLGEAEWASRQGWVAVRPLEEGDVIGVDALARPGPGTGQRSMSVPVAIEHAAGGVLEVGDTVDVISVAGDAAAYVVTGVEVVGMAVDERGGIGGSGAFHLVLSVDAEEALLLAEAIDSGSLEIVRSTGAEPISGSKTDDS